jgi:hypothetical protein
MQDAGLDWDRLPGVAAHGTRSMAVEDLRQFRPDVGEINGVPVVNLAVDRRWKTRRLSNITFLHAKKRLSSNMLCVWLIVAALSRSNAYHSLHS